MHKATLVLVLGLFLATISSTTAWPETQPHLLFTKGPDQRKPPEFFAHTVRQGEYLYAILRSFSVPEDRLGVWTRKVIALNPHIQNPDLVHPGTHLYLPQSLKTRFQDGQTSQKEPQKPGPIKKIARTITTSTTGSAQNNAPFQPSLLQGDARNSSPETALNRLFQLGFRFTRHKEIIYPQGQGQWVRIDLDSMPLASTPWGTSVLFVPQPHLSPSKFPDPPQNDLRVCPVPPSWSPRQVYAALEKVCRPNFILWSAQRPFIRSLPGKSSLEIRAPTILVYQENSQPKIVVFTQADSSTTSIPGLLFGYLRQQDITFVWDNDNLPTTAGQPPAIPRRENLLTPTLSWTDVHDQAPKAGSQTRNLNTDRTPVQTLQGQGLLHPHTLHLSWRAAQEVKITLHITLFKARRTEETLYFLPPAQADPYLVALLNLMGYSTYRLRY